MNNENMEMQISGIIKEMRIKNSIKKRPVATLKECLSCYTKADLTDIAREHGVFLKQSQKKDEMIHVLGQTLMANIARDSLYMTGSEREMLATIGAGDKVEADALGKLSTLQRIGYVYLFFHKDTFYSVCPKEIADQFMVAFYEENQDILERNQMIYNYIKALQELYGVYEVEQLLRIWNKYNKAKMDREEIYEYMNIVGNRQEYYWWDLPYIVTDYFQDQEEYLGFLELTTGREYYVPSKDEINFYMENEFEEESMYYQRLKGYFKNNNQLNEMELDDLMHTIVNDCTFDIPLQETIDDIEGMGCTFRDAKDMNYFMSLYIDVNNHTRKWSLKGHKPVELREEGVAKKAYSPPPKNVISFPGGNPSGKKKIGRNAPCPCGSGKKYKFCCIE